MSDAAAAYERYVTSTVAAMSAGDPSQIASASGQARAAAEARVVALTSQDRVARGTFIIDLQDESIDGDSASLVDCFRDDITELDEATEQQVADHGGARYGANVRLDLTDGDWTVVEFTQTDFCVPAVLAAELEARYLDFWDAVAVAGRPPDPDNAVLASVADGRQLEGLRERLGDFRDQGYEVRDESVSNPVASQVSNADTVGVVRDCRELDPTGGVYDAASGELVDGGAEPGQVALWETRLELIDGSWKVVDADLKEEDSACVPTDF